MTAAPASARSFAAWLRPKWPIHFALFAWAFCGVLLVPLFVQVFRSDLFLLGEDLWYRIDAIGWVRDHAGLSLMAQLWLAPLLAAAMVALATFAFEGAVFATRVDPGDDAWSSVVWSLRTWRTWLVWLLCAAFLIGVGAVWWKLVPTWQVLGFVPVLLAIGAVPFFALNAENLRPARPRTWWRPAWPGWKTIAFVVGVVAVPVCIFLIAGADDDSTSAPPTPAGMMLFAVYVLLDLVATNACVVLWLNRSRPTIRRVLAAACRPRLLLLVILQYVRFAWLVALALAPAFAIAFWLVYLVPQLEDSLKLHGASLPGAWRMLVNAGRFTAAYWWVVQLLLIGGLFGVGPIGTGWFTTTAMGRLFVQLGLVESAEPTVPR